MGYDVIGHFKIGHDVIGHSKVRMDNSGLGLSGIKTVLSTKKSNGLIRMAWFWPNKASKILSSTLPSNSSGWVIRSSHFWKWFKVINQSEYAFKDNLIKDFYDVWSIKETCDTITLESSHPLKSKAFEFGEIVYTHECEDDEIAYFKVDMNLIPTLQTLTFLGIVWEKYFS